MYVVELLNLETNKRFKRVFWTSYLKDKYINKCKYSKKIRVINIIDNSKYYD